MNLKNLAMWVVIVVLTIGLYNMFKNPQNLQNKNSKCISRHSNLENTSRFHANLLFL